jgi:predicted PurR-regulated permease PerM
METRPSPFLIKLSLVLFILIASGFILWIGQGIIVPIAFSFLLAVLLMPVVNFLERKLPRVISIILTLFIAVLFIAGLVYFLSWQIAHFMDDLPAIKQQINEHIRTIQTWIRSNFDLSRREQNAYVNDAVSQLKENGGMIGKTLLGVTGSLFTLFLIPIYTFLILYYREMIYEFLIDIFHGKSEAKAAEIISESQSLVFSYISGLLIEMGIVAVINSAGFLIIGVKYAIFLSVFVAIMNLIPYIGILIASVFCMMITLTSSSELSDVLLVGGVLVAVQFIDNNIIMPRVVGSKVKINALVTIWGILIGGAIAGISGMFLSIPTIAILKTTFDRIEDLKPWGMLLGAEEKKEERKKRKEKS